MLKELTIDQMIALVVATRPFSVGGTKIYRGNVQFWIEQQQQLFEKANEELFRRLIDNK